MMRSTLGLGEDNIGCGGLKKGPWTPEEDRKLMEYVEKHGCGNWQRIPKLLGLNRCGKSCRLRWTNYLRSDIKRGKFTEEEEQLIVHFHSHLGNRWSSIASKLPGRTDNEIKNYWNTHLRKKLLRKGIDPVTHRPTTAAANLNLLAGITSLLSSHSNLGNANSDNALKLQADVVARLLKLQLLQSLFQVLEVNSSSCSSTTTTSPNMNLISLPEMPSLINLISMVPNLSTLGQVSNNHNNIGFSTNIHGELVTTWDASGSEASMEKSNVSSTSSYFPATSNSTPPLVSSETLNVDLVKSSSSSNMHAADNSVSSTSFEPWENVKLDNLDNDDFGWKEIIDQMSWSDAS